MNKQNDFNFAVSFQNVSFAYKKKSDDVIKNVTFQIPKGSSLTIVGINGSGKSTIGKIIAGLLLHFNGQVTLFDQKLTESNYQNLIKHVGLVFQNPESQFIGEDVENDIAFGLENINVAPNLMPMKIKHIVQKLGISPLLNLKPVSLSGGDKQKVAIASVLVTEPKIIIFDEPTSMLDDKSQIEILNIIDQLKQERQVTVIEITHDLERILTSENVLVIKDGEVAFCGKAKDLFTKQGEAILKKSHLELPFIYKLSSALKKAGIIKQIFLNDEQLLQSL